MFPLRYDLKQGDALSPLLFNLSLKWAIKKVQANPNGLKLIVTYRYFIYADNINILGKRKPCDEKRRSFIWWYSGKSTRSKGL